MGSGRSGHLRRAASVSNRITRRRFLELGAGGLGMGALAACGTTDPEARSAARLTVRPTASSQTITPGLRPLGLVASPGRDGLFYVPTGYRPDQPAPMVIALHGATGSATGGLSPLRPYADAAGLILVAPESRLFSWDIRFGSFGADVAFIDQTLRMIFRTCNVDPARIYIQGFSDGASYALSLGQVNGDLFTRIVAFSPGFMEVPERNGKPPIFDSHGRQDIILNVDLTSRLFVPDLRKRGYLVHYEEFDGGHEVPTTIARNAVEWLASASAV